MSEKQFLPSNPLEHSLLKAKGDTGSMSQFFEDLIKSHVFVLADQEVAPTRGLNSSNNLCVLTNKSGRLVVPAFTAREIASPWHEREPKFQYELLVDAATLINALVPGVGLVLNPGHPIGVEIPAEAINSLKQQLDSRPAP